MSDETARILAWEAAGRAAAELVRDGDRVGLGTGRAAAAGIRALADRVRGGLRCTGVPTSPASARLARELGVPLGRMRGPLAVAFDGADIVTPTGLAVKGAGGAMVRERIVGDQAKRFLVLIDEPKIGDTLEPWGVLPLAVVPFAADHVMAALAHLSPSRRARRSDAGADWEALDREIRAVGGVVDTGLFHLVPDDVLVGAPDGTVRAVARTRGGG